MSKADCIHLPAVRKKLPSYQLREIFEASNQTVYALAKRSGVAAPIIHRFLTGERDIRVGTLDKLALALGLRLVVVGNAPKRKRGQAPGLSPEPSDEDESATTEET